MADIKVTTALVSDLIALQKKAVPRDSEDVSRQAEEKFADEEATKVDIDSGAKRLSGVILPEQDIDTGPTISDEAAQLLALDVRQKLENTNQSFAGESEKTVLSLFR